MMTQEEIWRFFSRVEIPSNPNDCWEWKGQIAWDGYGRFKMHKKPYIAHRLSYMIFNNRTDLDRWEFSCHSCDNRSCVNPAHLWLGSPKDNTHDMIKKGRHGQVKKTHCRNGHEYSDQNTYKWNGHRQCVICRNSALERRNKKVKQENQWTS